MNFDHVTTVSFQILRWVRDVIGHLKNEKSKDLLCFSVELKKYDEKFINQNNQSTYTSKYFPNHSKLWNSY